MCGINGIAGIKDHTLALEKVHSMNNRTAHRGPDDHGVWGEADIALGQRRLAIIDLSPAGHQPMHSANGNLVISFNGEIYNFRELKKELQGYPFRADNDTELILAAYQTWGTECFSKFRGMFGLAIWNREKRELLLARDPLGKKPVYYSIQNDVLVFSSEIRGVLASGLVKHRISRDALTDYLSYQTVFAPETILQDIRMLMPGSYAYFSNGKLEEKSFWKPLQQQSEPVPSSYEEAAIRVKELFFRSVERRMIADVPLGAFLSGGIDSSSVVAAMSSIRTERPVTFNIAFSEQRWNESEYAHTVARKFNTEHHTLNISLENFLHDIPAALADMDHPSGDGPNTWVVSRATKKAGITVALSGLGGDELFCGYPIFGYARALKKYSWIAKIPAALRGNAAALAATFSGSIAMRKMATVAALPDFGLEKVYPEYRRTLEGSRVKQLTGNTANRQRMQEILSQIPTGAHELSRYSVAEISTYMQNILLRDTDQMSMAHALEVRVPFLDIDLVDFVLSLPDEWKPAGRPKQLLLDAMGDLLPEEVWNRPKMGFTFPWNEWLRKDLSALCREELGWLENTGLFSPGSVSGLWKAFEEGSKTVTWTRIWPLVVLGSWMRNNNIDA